MLANHIQNFNTNFIHTFKKDNISETYFFENSKFQTEFLKRKMFPSIDCLIAGFLLMLFDKSLCKYSEYKQKKSHFWNPLKWTYPKACSSLNLCWLHGMRIIFFFRLKSFSIRLKSYEQQSVRYLKISHQL